MKDVIKVGIVSIVVLLLLWLSLFIVGNAEYGIELLSRNKLDYRDPTIQVLFDRIKMTNKMRKANLLNVDLKSEDIIKFTFDNIKNDEYKNKSVDAEKIVCQVTSSISFTIDGNKCNIRIIDNDVFMDYQKKYFNTEIQLQFDNINYNGLSCINDSNKYYCLVNDYTETIIGYSEFDSAYETKDKVIINEYYLQVDLKDNERCKKYFGEEFCNDYKNIERPLINKDIIIEEGVLYEHVFVKNGDSYYLESSFIVSER